MNNIIPVVTLRDLNFKEKPGQRPAVLIPMGTKLDIAFSEKNYVKAVFNHNGNWHALMVQNLHSTVKATNGVKFQTMPSINRLEKMSNDGVCTTVTGKRVEPDGVAEDGSASWLLVAGVI